MFISSARRKNQRSIHPYQTSPYMGRLRSGADNAALHTKVKSTIKGSILEFIGWRMEYMIEGHIGKCDQEE